MCAEGLSALLNRADVEGQLKGITLANGAPSINHLLFADDSLLLFEANPQDALAINAILQTYELWSGQMVNRDKSSILFSRNTPRAKKEEIMQILEL